MLAPVTIDMALVYPNNHGRSVQKDKVAALAESLKAIGLRTPITVRRVKKVSDGRDIDAYEIVTGRHRYEAAVRLCWREIDAFVTDGDEIDAELWEIDENLMRAELTPAEEASHLKRRKELWAAKNSGNSVPTIPTGPGRPAEFASDTAEKTGRTKRSINEHIARAEALGDDIAAVVGTSLDKGVELDALKAMPQGERRALIERAQAGEKVSARQYVPQDRRTTKAEDKDLGEEAAEKIAALIAEHVPGECWEGIKANLYATNTKAIARALTRLTGVAVFDKNGGWK